MLDTVESSAPRLFALGWVPNLPPGTHKWEHLLSCISPKLMRNPEGFPLDNQPWSWSWQGFPSFNLGYLGIGIHSLALWDPSTGLLVPPQSRAQLLISGFSQRLWEHSFRWILFQKGGPVAQRLHFASVPESVPKNVRACRGKGKKVLIIGLLPPQHPMLIVQTLQAFLQLFNQMDGRFNTGHETINPQGDICYMVVSILRGGPRSSSSWWCAKSSGSEKNQLLNCRLLATTTKPKQKI